MKNNDSLDSLFSAVKKNDPAWKPILYNLQEAADGIRLKELFAQGAITHLVDDYEAQLREHFQVTHPSLVFSERFEAAFQAHRASLEKDNPIHLQGVWVYYSWISTLVHILEDEPFQKVRMARNRNLITEEEQKKFYNGRVGVAGLSVGSSVALAIVLQGGAQRINLADHDRLELSNTNRIRTGVSELGLPKVVATARQIYLINPYADVELFPDGLTENTLPAFFDGLDIVVDEIDNLAIKYRIREFAQRLRLPVVMAADNGDNGVVDIERYDLDPETPFFHGRMGEVSYESLRTLDKRGIGRMITKHVGLENVTPRMQESLLEIGKTIVSWPQLGGAALLNGSAVAYCVRRILCGEPLEADRAIISLDEKLIPDYNSEPERTARSTAAEKMKAALGIE